MLLFVFEERRLFVSGFLFSVMRWRLGLIRDGSVILLIFGNEVANLIQIKRLDLL
jgi:hypothetical protein